MSAQTNDDIENKTNNELTTTSRFFNNNFYNQQITPPPSEKFLRIIIIDYTVCDLKLENHSTIQASIPTVILHLQMG